MDDHHLDNDPQSVILKLLANNKAYVAQMKEDDPNHFQDLSTIQKPDYLYIGCADSRVPANEIMGLKSGEVFVHRNIANLVSQSDFNCLSVVQYAVDHLKIQQILVVGHYGCGGVKASLLEQNDLGLFQNWTKQIRDLTQFYSKELDGLSEDQIHTEMCEYNVVWQVKNLCQSTIVQSAWQRGQILNVHGLIYDLKDGILQDMGVHIDGIKAYKSFEADLWGKNFIPHPKDLLARVPSKMTDEVRRSIFRELTVELSYPENPRISQISRGEQEEARISNASRGAENNCNDGPRMTLFNNDFENIRKPSLNKGTKEESKEDDDSPNHGKIADFLK